MTAFIIPKNTDPTIAAQGVSLKPDKSAAVNMIAAMFKIHRIIHPCTIYIDPFPTLFRPFQYMIISKLIQ